MYRINAIVQLQFSYKKIILRGFLLFYLSLSALFCMYHNTAQNAKYEILICETSILLLNF